MQFRNLRLSYEQKTDGTFGINLEDKTKILLRPTAITGK